MISAQEVAKHNSRDSCWVIIHNTVYDVTTFLDSHPGGPASILRLAGRDATSEFDPIHPSDTLTSNLTPSQILGPLDLSTVSSPPTSSATSATPLADLPPLSYNLNLHDFATTAQRLLSPKAWAYYSSAGDDLQSLRLNSDIFSRILLRPRIFRDVTTVSTSTTLLGVPSSLPIFIAPAAMARLAHPDGEAAICRAAGTVGIIQCISTNASLRPEEISAVRTSPTQKLWFQLYVNTDRSRSEALLARISEPDSGFCAVVLTLDAPTPGKREADERVAHSDGVPLISAASGKGVEAGDSGKGLGKALFVGTAADLTWKNCLPWLRAHTHLPIILKGVQTHQDAVLAAAAGVQGIVLSNHGGRALDTAPPAILTLLEIRQYCPDVLRRLEVYTDGGIRRGTDVLKALALGARAVGIGRPALYSLAGYGQEGVERVVRILREEVETGMRLLGATSVGEVDRDCVNIERVRGWVHVNEEEEAAGRRRGRGKGAARL